MFKKHYAALLTLTALFAANLAIAAEGIEEQRTSPAIDAPAPEPKGEPAAKPATDAPSQASKLTEEQVIAARNEFKLEVLSTDTSKPYGSQFPYSDLVKLKITNNSGVTLPYLTVFTKRYSGGRVVGWSRVPPIDVQDLKPKQSKTIDYYPRGHLSVVTVDKLVVEIEPIIDRENRLFIKELE